MSRVRIGSQLHYNGKHCLNVYPTDREANPSLWWPCQIPNATASDGCLTGTAEVQTWPSLDLAFTQYHAVYLHAIKSWPEDQLNLSHDTKDEKYIKQWTKNKNPGSLVERSVKAVRVGEMKLQGKNLLGLLVLVHGAATKRCKTAKSASSTAKDALSWHSGPTRVYAPWEREKETNKIRKTQQYKLLTIWRKPQTAHSQDKMEDIIDFYRATLY